MTDDQFQSFLDQAVDGLEQKQGLLQHEFGLGGFARWHFDQSTEKLQFFDAQDHLACEADVVHIGSFASNSNTWYWSWANESLLPGIRRRAEPLKKLADVTGFAMFESASPLSVEGESMAWELVAMSVQHLQALGAYKAPSSAKPLLSFMAITAVNRRMP